MKIATLRIDGSTVAARRDADQFTLIDAFADAGALLTHPEWRQIAENSSGRTIPADVADFAPVIPRPGKIVCVGLNYRSHILEMGRELPDYPTLFSKFPETLVGAYDDIELPDEDASVDWEAELGVVIGKGGRRITEEQAAEHIAGFTVCSDISMRTWQFRTGEWLQGKNWEKSTPLGPELTTRDEWSPGPMIRTLVDGEVVQEASTGDLVHGPEHLVSYISTMVTLNPGDLIITGTPGGVGHARSPQRYLEEGQQLETMIDGLGTLRNYARAAVTARV